VEINRKMYADNAVMVVKFPDAMENNEGSGDR
jgi:hypothetical protein